MNRFFSKNADRIGIISSSLCLVHCIALPLLISLQPALISFLHDDMHFVEYIFLLLSVVAVFFATRSTHMSDSTRKLFYVVLGVFTLSILLGERFHWLHYIGYLGSFALIVLHIINIRQCQRCEIHTVATAEAEN